MRVLGVMVILAGLAACGVDGEPTRPEAKEPISVNVTGVAKVGVTGGSN